MATSSPAVISDTSILRLFEQNGMRGIADGNYFTNGIDTRTTGVDLTTSHAFLLGTRALRRVSGGYNRNRSRVMRVAAAPAPLERFCTFIPEGCHLLE